MSKMFFWTQGRNYGKSQFFKQMEEEMRMSRGREVPIAVETGEAYGRVIKELSETYVKKNIDYGNSFEKTLDKRGLIPAIVRMEEKMERMEQLWGTEKTLVEDESIIDSAMDLANYAIMTAMWLKKKQIKTNNAKYGGADFDGDTIKISDKEIGRFNFPIGQQFNSNEK